MKKLYILAFLALAFPFFGNAARPVKVPADLDLVGYYHRLPYNWDAARFAPHVSFTDAAGRERWLFEAFLFIEGHDTARNLNLALSGTGRSARKESWEDQLALWLSPGGGVSELDRACALAAERIGPPKARRMVVIAIPDAIMFEIFADKKSSTKYWGAVGKDSLDFASDRDRIKAYRWYIDKAREMFDALGCKYLELGGFYITSEELNLPWGETSLERLNCQYKRWEKIIPEVSSYCHSKGQGLYWIPYNMAPGYRHWKRLGFDMAWMQPNYYWDLKTPGRHPFDRTVEEIKKYGMGMETEFEFSMVEDEMSRVHSGPDGQGNPAFKEEDVPALREQFREYMRRFRDAGLYGKAPLAIYTGSNALTQLAVSPVPADRALYREFCEFIADNPLRYDWKPSGAEISDSGMLTSLRDAVTGWNYSGGSGLWRLYYNTPEEKEIEVLPSGQEPVVKREKGKTTIEYRGLKSRGKEVKIDLTLVITEEGDGLRFSAELSNNEPHTIVRELQYPLVGNLNLPEEYKLLTTHTGGQLFDSPLEAILNVPAKTLYMKPDQYFRQYDLQYPRNAASNCFAFVGEEGGLYFGSHDPSFQQTWHGLRAYPSEGETSSKGEFNRIEAGFYRYPNAFCGDPWSNDTSVIIPYRGDWTVTSGIYRSWADSWWDKKPVPKWVQDMTGWQRIIFKHQYGEYLRHYEDLPGRIFEAGKKAGSNAVLAFGWWKEGMDNGYPDYSPDDSQGGDPAWAGRIAEYKDKGGRLILYYNGRLIDNESSFYKSGEASKVSNHDNTGDEFTEHYKFTGRGTTLGYYDSRTFVIADMSRRQWRDRLLSWADRAMALGANSVFYDQLGVAEEFPNWDLSREYPVPDIFTGRYKAEALKEIRDHIKARDPEFCLGTEWLSDCTSRYCDFVHIVEFTALPESFPEWFRYTFPEVVWSDRCVRDEVDMVRRVNNTIVKGLRNDIEVYRCRGLIDETPEYQEYLGKVNAIRNTYPELLLEGRFAWHDDFSITDGSVTACEYVSGDRLAVVATSEKQGVSNAGIEVPGYRFEEFRTLGEATVHGSGPSVGLTLGQYGLAVLVFVKAE